MFYLLAVSASVRFAKQSRPRWYLSALASYVGGLLSKSVVVTLPVALLIWHSPTAVLVVLLVSILGTLTWRQVGIYRDAVTFFTHVVSQ